MGFLIYDGIVLAILILFAVLGWRKGLLLSLCGLAVAIVAFLGAGVVADTLDGPVADAIVPMLESSMEKRITLHYDDSGVDTAVDALREENGLFAWAADAVEEALEKQEILPSVSDIASTAAQFVAQRIAHSVLFALSFLALYVLLTILLHVLDLVAKLPGLDFCNGLGGGVIGLVKGGLIVLVGVAVLMSTSLQPDPKTLESSYLLRGFVAYNPILTLLGG